ncbi:hypothetical protein F5B20DRAFT_84737 [Whalleya microplaca]|nr:hypothetical protein F5B20DRAFT_84737 [Whalleya microplaca]
MTRSNLKLAALLFLSAMAGQGLAANCFNSPKWQHFDKVYDDVWGVRGKICGGSADCKENKNGGVTCQADVGAGISVVYAGFFGTDKDKALKQCWTAFENIANQCIYKDKNGGFYHSDDGSYWLQSFVISSEAPSSGAH